jgi:chromate transporter
MTAVTLSLGAGSLTDGFTILLTLGTFVILLRFKINSTWLVLGGAGLGWLVKLFF